jgi:YHS domain-containing protein
MFRAILELLFTILIVIVARALLTSLLRGMTGRSLHRFRDGSGGAGTDASHPTRAAGELHKDPVCGTYVAESTPFRRQIGRQAFYYCSDACRQKHALAG